MLIVDSSVWIDSLVGRETPQVQALRELACRRRIGVGDLILCEVLQGIRDQKRFEEVRDGLLAYEILDMGGTEVALQAADNYRALRRRGITVRGLVDCLIATFCIEHDHVLLHNDGDFDAFEQHLGLQVLHPGAQP